MRARGRIRTARGLILVEAWTGPCLPRKRYPPITADLAAYAGLFVNAFVAATLIPIPSEPAFIALLATGTGHPALLLVVATLGNTVGALTNFALGRGIEHYRERPWFPVSQERYEAACAQFGRYGVWALLLSWIPVLGDPLTIAAGALRVPLMKFLLLTGLGKAIRYGVLMAGVEWWVG
jgi:membrane protein YqaA with SNARE-associated domain